MFAVSLHYTNVIIYIMASTFDDNGITSSSGMLMGMFGIMTA